MAKYSFTKRVRLVIEAKDRGAALKMAEKWSGQQSSFTTQSGGMWLEWDGKSAFTSSRKLK